jgi:bifunctional non-homologous end joining protein LigD
LGETGPRGRDRFAELTGDGILRHPSFIGLRGDKPAKAVTLERAMTDSSDEVTDDHFEDGEAVAEKLGVRLTSPDRVVFPGQGVTKADLVGYYEAVAEEMLPHLSKRPLSLVRCPQGRTKACFFQKHDTGGFPPQIKSLPVAEKDGDKQSYFYVEDLAGIVAGTQMNTLEWHIWGSRTNVEKPDRLVFDIDPDEGLDFGAVRDAALDIRERLTALGLVSYAMVSGGKGIHVIVPLRPLAEWDDVKAFCRGLAQKMAEDEPDRFTANLSKARRKGRLFIDYLRNERGSTAISPWSVRSREGAPVAVPVTWDELDAVKAANQFGLADAAARAKGADPWKGYFSTTQSITKAMWSAVDGPKT